MRNSFEVFKDLSAIHYSTIESEKIDVLKKLRSYYYISDENDLNVTDCAFASLTFHYLEKESSVEELEKQLISHNLKSFPNFNSCSEK